MTIPHDLRDAPQHVVKQEIQMLDDYTINQAIKGYGGPKITPGQESTLRSELNKRRQDDMYAAQLADEARASRFEPDALIDPDPITSLQSDPLKSLPTENLDPIHSDLPSDPTQGVNTSSEPTTEYSSQPATTPDMTPSQGDSSPTKITTQPTLSESERRALQLIGALLIEAIVIRRTRDTIQSVINDSDEIHLFDPSVPQQLTSHLWETYDRSGRSEYVTAILDHDQSTAMDSIRSLSGEIGIEID